MTVPAHPAPSTLASSPGPVTLPRPSRSVRVTRIVLIVFGVLLLMLGAYVMDTTVRTKSIWGLVTWLIGAVILHDGILSPIVVGIGVLLQRRGRRIPASVIWIVQGAVFVGSVFTLVVVPEIVRKAKVPGPQNYTVLPFDYAPRLAILWGAIALVSVLLIVVTLRVRRRRAARA